MLCIGLQVARTQTEFCRSCPHKQKRLSRSVLYSQTGQYDPLYAFPNFVTLRTKSITVIPKHVSQLNIYASHFQASPREKHTQELLAESEQITNCVT
jgi:hypothetical protein